MYTIYIKLDYNLGSIYTPYAYPTWIAAVRNGYSVDPSIQPNIKNYKSVSHTDLYECIKKAWYKYNDEYILLCYNEWQFEQVIHSSLNTWSCKVEAPSTEIEYGARCTKCLNVNEYLEKQDDYICYSCKSYAQMYA